jgi:hypothetical protein
MRELKPVTVRRGMFGTWFATRGVKRGPSTTVVQVDTKMTIENQSELEAMYDSHGWLTALLEATGKTRDQIADDYDLVIGVRDSDGVLHGAES